MPAGVADPAEEGAHESDADGDGEADGLPSVDLSLDGLGKSRILTAAGAGVAAFVLGYLVIGAYILLGPAELSDDLSITESLTRVAFFFYNAQTIDLVTIQPPDGSGLFPERFNLIGERWQRALIPGPIWLATPILVISSVGAFTAARFEDVSRWTPGVVGVGMTVGYLATAAFGSFLFTMQFADGSVIHPDRVRTALVGVIYPLLFGSFGALVVTLSRSGPDVEDQADSDVE